MLGRQCFLKALVWSTATLVVLGLSDSSPSQVSNTHWANYQSTNDEKVQGFLPENYIIQNTGDHLGKRMATQIRQVPGDGNCLFHAISASLEYIVNGTHPR